MLYDNICLHMDKIGHKQVLTYGKRCMQAKYLDLIVLEMIMLMLQFRKILEEDSLDLKK